MEIEKNTVVTLRCQLFDASGECLDPGTSPLVYLHGGNDGIFPPLATMLEGKTVGEMVTAVLPPEDAYGEVDVQLIMQAPRSAFPPEIQVGMIFGGGPRPVYDEETVAYRVVAFDDERVVLDGNHPLAGRTLQASCTVQDVRAATTEEIEAGKSLSE